MLQAQILHISYKDHVTKEEFRAKIQQATGPHEDLLTTVTRQTAVVLSCLPFIRSGQNQIARHSEKRKKKGRQRKRWEDNIGDWPGLEFASPRGQ